MERPKLSNVGCGFGIFNAYDAMREHSKKQDKYIDYLLEKMERILQIHGIIQMEQNKVWFPQEEARQAGMAVKKK